MARKAGEILSAPRRNGGTEEKPPGREASFAVDLEQIFD